VTSRSADWIWVPFEMVSGVGGGMGLLDGHPRVLRGTEVSGFFAPLVWSIFTTQCTIVQTAVL